MNDGHVLNHVIIHDVNDFLHLFNQDVIHNYYYFTHNFKKESFLIHVRVSVLKFAIIIIQQYIWLITFIATLIFVINHSFNFSFNDFHFNLNCCNIIIKDCYYVINGLTNLKHGHNQDILVIIIINYFNLNFFMQTFWARGEEVVQVVNAYIFYFYFIILKFPLSWNLGNFNKNDHYAMVFSNCVPVC